MKNTTIFERILQIIEFYNIKSVNSFAKDYLKYDSSEKINRLKDGTKRPSFEILEDITNNFEDIDANWLLSGKGNMLKSNVQVYESKEISISDESHGVNQNYKTFIRAIEVFKNQMVKKDNTISDLLKHQEILLEQISKLTDKIK